MKNNNSGFTLMETIITAFILVFAAVALTKFLITIQYSAEDNLYDATALSVASSALEQMKNVKFDQLGAIQAAGVFELKSGQNITPYTLNLGQPNTMSVPIIVDDAGNPKKTMDITLTPTVTAALTVRGYWLEIEYSYENFRTNLVHTRTLRAMSSAVPIF